MLLLISSFLCIIIRDVFMKKYNCKEFKKIIEPILSISEFNKLSSVEHHGINRFDHSLRVAYFTYMVTKSLHLNYKEATEAALLHDFFTDEVDGENGVMRLRRHPDYAVKNAEKYFLLSDLQRDIIKTHMFPVTFTPPKYLESWIVDLVDDVASIYERGYTIRKQLVTAGTLLFLVIVNYFKIR